MSIGRSIARKLASLFTGLPSRPNTSEQLHGFDIELRLVNERKYLVNRLTTSQPRILVVKQDVNEDLYCCTAGTPHDQMILSTLLRTGPVALFTDGKARFQIVRTEETPACSIWKERATHLKWDTLEFFSSYQRQVPGREYGQASLAVSAHEIDWSTVDIVVSIDISIPEEIVKANPRILWTYYVREIKAPAYLASLQAPIGGYDRVLNHYFRLNPPGLPKHVLEFPYHLHYYGCFHRLLSLPLPESTARRGVFVDHHTMVKLSAAQREELRAFGDVTSTVHPGDREVIPTSEKLARRTMDRDLREALLNCRYFLITPGQRSVFGTALVEAIAAGCLAIGSPEAFREHGYLFNSATSATDVEAAIAKMKQFEQDHQAYDMEVARQRVLIDYTCFVRPLTELLNAWDVKRKHYPITKAV